MQVVKKFFPLNISNASFCSAKPRHVKESVFHGALMNGGNCRGEGGHAASTLTGVTC